jgi:hypothetical protein
MDKFTRASLAVEYEGEVYLVRIPKDSLKIALSMIAGFSPKETLQLVKAPSDYKFQELG